MIIFKAWLYYTLFINRIRCNLLLGRNKTEFLDHNKCCLGYRVIGEGEPLLMISGWKYTMLDWNHAFLKELSKRYKLIIFDHPGVGKSYALKGVYSIAAIADYASQLLQKLDIIRINILGYSMGSKVALEFALRYPLLVNKMILCAADCGGKEAVNADIDKIMQGVHLCGMSRDDRRDLLSLMRGHKKESSSDDNLKYRSAEYCQSVAMINWEGCYGRLTSIKQPVLLMAGKSDSIVPVQNTEILASRLRNAQIKIFDGCKHGFIAQCPKPISDAIVSFLS